MLYLGAGKGSFGADVAQPRQRSRQQGPSLEYPKELSNLCQLLIATVRRRLAVVSVWFNMVSSQHDHVGSLTSRISARVRAGTGDLECMLNLSVLLSLLEVVGSRPGIMIAYQDIFGSF